MHISDLNFGMYIKDLEICDYINEIQEEYNFPKLNKSCYAFSNYVKSNFLI